MQLAKLSSPVPESTQLCVLYDPKDGRIVHMHKVVTYPGGRKLNAAQMDARTLELAAKAGWEISKLKSLQPPAEQFAPRKLYKVDVKSRRVVEVPAPADFRSYREDLRKQAAAQAKKGSPTKKRR